MEVYPLVMTTVTHIYIYIEWPFIVSFPIRNDDRQFAIGNEIVSFPIENGEFSELC